MRCGRNLKSKIFKHVTQKSYLGTHSVVALRWMPRNFTDGKSTLVVVIAWCHQATCHLLSQCCPKSMSPYGIIRPQWVKRIRVVTVRITDNADITELKNKNIDYEFDVQWWKKYMVRITQELHLGNWSQNCLISGCHEDVDVLFYHLIIIK